ncbi:MAG: hypothetical protein [Malazfec virus 1]
MFNTPQKFSGYLPVVELPNAFKQFYTLQKLSGYLPQILSGLVSSHSG